MVNARYVSHVWRIGLHLEGKLQRKEIERAIRRVMVEATEGHEMRERILQLKEKVDVCLKKGGSSYQSRQRLTRSPRLNREAQVLGSTFKPVPQPRLEVLARTGRHKSSQQRRLPCDSNWGANSVKPLKETPLPVKPTLYW
ncbi:hypothetical protein WN943_006116 [Citrus x changshan-huyou]